MLLPLIKKFKNYDMTVFPLIFDEFKNIIRHYAVRLHYEDATADLNLFFVELLYSIDLSRFEMDYSFGLRGYIAVSIKNRYISLSVSKLKQSNMYEPFFENVNGYTETFDDRIVIKMALRGLSDKQKNVLIHKYIYGYSDVEISKRFSVSRQAVNAIKRRAIENLKEYIKGE
jgi:RNA polymerase sigma factor (sigma-70 family)